MKKSLVLLIFAVIVCLSAKSQVDKNALGIRFGGGAISGAEVSYQLGLSSKNRLELDLGFGGNKHYSAIGFTGIYQWVWPIGKEGFNWYAGPGAGIGIFSGKDNFDDYVGLSVGGQVGLGYAFNKIPLQLTIDTRPMFDFLSDDDSFGWGISLGVRYRF